jgi:two-component system CheB/CheR fusion protein
MMVERIRPLIGSAFVDTAGGETMVEAVNRRGKHTRLRVTCSVFRSPAGSVSGALLLMEAYPET